MGVGKSGAGERVEPLKLSFLESSSTTALGLAFVSFGHEIFYILMNVYI